MASEPPDFPDLDDLRVRPGDQPGLRDRDTSPHPKVAKRTARAELAKVTAESAELQEQLYAVGTRAVLLVFQAMDAAGKDSTIAHVMSGINPQGCEVTSFKQPSEEELAHDFLWRANCALPALGHIGVFNRSHYEETLVVRVHPELLAGQHLTADSRPTKQLWKRRYTSINAFERHLTNNGTTVVKFFLHVSRNEQRKRLLARLDDPSKRWKFNPADVAERERWDDYADAYEDTLHATSTRWAPWYVIPADHKPTMQLLVAHVLRDTLRGFDLEHPEPTKQWWVDAEAARTTLLADH